MLHDKVYRNPAWHRDSLPTPAFSGQAGLVGNRAVAANPWSVVSSLARAFPLLLGSAAEAARSQAEQQARDDPSGTLLRLWVVEV